MGLSYSGAITVVSGGFNTNTNTPPAWATTAGSLGSATGGHPFSFNLSATDADGETVTYRLSSGSMPAGLSMNNAGQISGTAVNNPGTYNFTVIASDGTIDIPRDFSITVTNTTPTWTTAGGALTIAHRNVAYTTTVVAADANYDTVSFSLYSGTLPTGITLNGTTGQLSGTPTVENTFSFVLRADDGHGATADRSFSIEVTNDSPVWQSPNATLTGPYTQNSAISAITLVATDANSDAITYALYSSTLPAGLTLSGSQITGTPTGYGTGLSFTIRASDVGGAYADRTFTMDIAASDPYAANVKGLYHFDGTANDSSSAAHHGSLEFDPYWNNVSCLFHFNNVHGTGPGVSRELTTKKFGTSSLKTFRDGNLKITTTSEFASTNLTVECWIYVPSSETTIGTSFAQYGTIMGFDQYNGAWHNVPLVFYDYGLNRVQFSMMSVGSVYSSTLARDTWHHVAIVKTGTSNVLYVNGSSSGTLTGTYSTITAQPFTIGGYEENGWNTVMTGGFYGYIDEVRVSDTNRYSSNFTPSASAFTSDGNTVLLLHMDDASFTDSSSYARTVTQQTYTTFDDKKGHVFTSYGSATPFESTTQKIMGTHSQYFNGGTYMVTPSNALSDFQLGSGDFTIECWVYLSSTNVNQGIIGNWGPSGNAGWALYTNGSGNIVFNWTTNGSTVNNITFSSISVNTWTHVAICRNGSTVRGYKNAVQQITASISGTVYPSTYGFVVGWIPGTALVTTGYVDELRITKGVDRYQGQSFGIYCESGDTNPTFATGKFSQGYQSASMPARLDLGGGTHAAGYISVPYHTDFNLASSADFTFELWANLQTNASGYYYLFTLGNPGNAIPPSYGECYSLSYDHSSFKLYFGYYNSGGSYTSIAATTGSNLYNAWKHVAISNSTSGFMMYVDGTRVYNASKLTNLALNGTPTVLRIGDACTSLRENAYNWNGLLDDLRFTRAGRYTGASYTPPTSAY